MEKDTDREAPLGHICGLKPLWQGIPIRRGVLIYAYLLAAFHVFGTIGMFTDDFVLVTGGYSVTTRYISYVFGLPALCICVYAIQGIFDNQPFNVKVLAYFIALRLVLLLVVFVLDTKVLNTCQMQGGVQAGEPGFNPTLSRVARHGTCHMVLDIYYVKCIIDFVLSAYMVFATAYLSLMMARPRYLITFQADPFFNEQTPLMK